MHLLKTPICCIITVKLSYISNYAKLNLLKKERLLNTGNIWVVLFRCYHYVINHHICNNSWWNAASFWCDTLNRLAKKLRTRLRVTVWQSLSYIKVFCQSFLYLDLNIFDTYSYIGQYIPYIHLLLSVGAMVPFVNVQQNSLCGTK